MGRGLIGLGVSACLMASFKAFVLWFPAARLPALNGWVLAAGGLGALVATAPVEAALRVIDWRGLFVVLAGLSCLVAAALLLAVPERDGDETAVGDWRAQWREIAGLFRSPVFWRIAPGAVLSQSSFLSIQGLWAGPWLRDVSGLDKLAAANCLFWVAVAMVAGFLGMGQLAYRLTRHGIPPLAVSASGMVLFMGVQLAILLDWGPLLPLWIAFGFFGTSGVLSYAVLSQSFPLTLSGRVNTALNLLVFVAAFTGQWGMGAMINHWPLAGGGYADIGYRWASGWCWRGSR